MALFMYPHGSNYAPVRRHHDPFSEVDRVFDHFLDDSVNPLFGVPRISIPRINDEGKFTTTISTRDYAPSELKVEVDGRDLVVRGEHASSDEHGGSMHRRFEQRLRIPDPVDLKSIRCNFDEVKHALQFVGQAVIEPKEDKTIPITFKNTPPAIESNKHKS